MKFVIFITIFSLPASIFSEVRPAATKESLLAKRQELAAQRKGNLVKPVSNEVSIQTRAEGTSIMDSSSYLVGERGYTLVPNGSVPSVGKLFALTSSQPEALPFMKWTEFLRSHRNGLQTIPIPQRMLSPEANTQTIRGQITSIQKLGVTCVTTYKQQPVRIAQSTANSKS